MKEIWKDIKGYEGLYQVSNFGRVKRLTNYYQANGVKYVPTHLNAGLPMLQLIKDKKTQSKFIHKLVAEAFIPNPNNYKYVIHIDGNRENNNVNNLYWSSSKKILFGVAMNDVGDIFLENGKEKPAYRAWSGMLARCYNEKIRHKHPTYIDCYVCDEWLLFSNFKKWFEDVSNGYIEGHEIDKDIICKGNRVYSPQTCCLVPQEINKLFTKNNKKRGLLPIGVCLERSGRYRAKLQPDGKVVSLGTYETVDEAFAAYKEAKEKRIKDLATKYYNEGKITKRVYDAMQKYVVEITD